MKVLHFILLLTLFICSCSQVEKEWIKGEWQGVSILEKGQKLEIDPQEIRLHFFADHKYTYQSTLKYEEAGTYHMDKKYLYTIDTVNQASTQKAVEIILLTEDSLHLKMMENGQERLLKMEKIN